jgi:hypothetical protein
MGIRVFLGTSKKHEIELGPTVIYTEGSNLSIQSIGYSTNGKKE